MSRPQGTEEKIKATLPGWYDPALSRMVSAVMNGDFYDECPLKRAGFTRVHLSELGTIILGPDGKCICTTAARCTNCDKVDGVRCTEKQLEQLNYEAAQRRARQSGWND